MSVFFQFLVYGSNLPKNVFCNPLKYKESNLGGTIYTFYFIWRFRRHLADSGKYLFSICFSHFGHFKCLVSRFSLSYFIHIFQTESPPPQVILFLSLTEMPLFLLWFYTYFTQFFTVFRFPCSFWDLVEMIFGFCLDIFVLQFCHFDIFRVFLPFWGFV